MSKYRILTVINDLRLAGAEMNTVQILKRLNQDLFSGIVCCLGDRDDLRADLEQSGHRVVLLKRPLFESSGKSRKEAFLRAHTYELFATTLLIMRLMRYENIDIVSSILGPSFFYGTLAARSLLKPSVVTFQSTLGYVLAPSFPFFFVFSHLNDRIVAASRAIKEDLQRRLAIGSNRICLIPNGVDPVKFDPCARDLRRIEEIRQRLSLGESSIVIGTVANLIQPKNQEFLLRSFALATKEIAGAKLLIVGDGPLLHRLKNLANDLGIDDRVIFAGAQRDIPEYLSTMDIFTLPSAREGLGIAIIEAMLMEKPVVATRVGGIPEVVADGITGLLVAPGDRYGLAKALIALSKDPLKRKLFGAEGRKRAIEQYSIEKSAEAFQNLLLPLLERHC